jgi:GT2 family glycosyltransferase
VRACIVRFNKNHPEGGLDQIASVLLEQGWDVTQHWVDPSAVGRMDGRRGEIANSFEHTPQPLMDSWMFADIVRDVAGGCDAVILSDRGGLGGIFALESSNRRIEGSPQVWTVTGESLVLKYLRTGRSLATTDEDRESVVDWEIAQYVASDAVICRAPIESELLKSIGVETVCVQIAKGSIEPVSARSKLVAAPGLVSRLNASGEVLRAVSGFSDISVVFGESDAADEYWSGTAWESLAGLRNMLGERVSRRPDIPERTDLVVIGDPFNDYLDVMQWAATSSTPVAAPRGSVVAQQWTGVAQWDSVDELSDIIGGVDPESDSVAFPGFVPPTAADVRPERAHRISIGIPVFGECPFLGELVESVAAQSPRAHEIIIVSDGPPSQTLTDVLEEWTGVFENRLIYLEQPNRGVCVARNLILDSMTGDAVMLVDQDDLLTDNTLKWMSVALQSNPRIDAVACWTEFFGQYNGIEAKPPFDRRVGMRENPIVSTAVLIDREAIDAGVRFEPDLAFLYCEDWNVWAEMVSRGYTLGLVPEPLVRHRVHGASGGFRRTDLALEVGRDRARRKLRSPTTG